METLGTILDNNQRRDAIHLAVEPVEAGENLRPGQHITVVDRVAYKTEVGKGLVIVDPFLESGVKKGQKFWFVMYPRAVHSLRHVWTHPAFKDEVAAAPISKEDKSASETWIRNFLSNSDCPDYDTVMELIQTGKIESPDKEYYGTGGVYTSEYLHFNGSDAHGAIPPEFWDHAETVLGVKLVKRPEYFSCSC